MACPPFVVSGYKISEMSTPVVPEPDVIGTAVAAPMVVASSYHASADPVADARIL